jgi:phenylacetate-coenzyme A ligase PaaK-like adenylate-forming protein
MNNELSNRIFQAKEADFEKLALEIFQFQYDHNSLYKSYVDHLFIDPRKVKALQQIPFLPIQFFKTQEVKTTSFEPEMVFESSGTTGSVNSKHFVKNLSLYQRSFVAAFKMQYGPVGDYCILALLPSYLERKGSSLVFMAEELIKASGHDQSGFYLYDHDRLAQSLKWLEQKQIKAILLGVTYALLDFAAKYPMPLKQTIVIETGGMKGRRKEIVRSEVHEILKKCFGLPQIESEYGMTELLSQAYSRENGIFVPAPWMKVLVRDERDPFDVRMHGEGVLNIVDLANIYSCSFIATEDAGQVSPDGNFSVVGRVENSDMRGCSLLVS